MTVGRIPSVEGGIQPTLLTTKGDIIVATGNATLVRQGVGANGTVLTANSAQADGVEWATPTSAGLVLLASNTFTAVSSFSLPTSTFSSTYRNYKVIFNIDDNASSSGVFLRMRNAGTDKTSASYYGGSFNIPYTGSTSLVFQTTAGTSQQILYGNTNIICNLEIGNPFVSTNRTSIFVDSVDGNLVARQTGIGTLLSNDSCDSLTIFLTAGTMTGRYTVYGYAQ
jgi:hypothetical protein